MEHHWDHYLCKMGDDLASIYLDLGLVDGAPLAGYPHHIAMTVPMAKPAENGMSTDEEFADLIALEDGLVAGIDADNSVYAGRLTTRGSRVFYFYATDPDMLARDISDAMERHPEYAYEISNRPDPDWEFYFKCLYPSAEVHQRMQNRRLN